MLPSILAKQLQRGIKDYITATFPMANAPFSGSLERMLNTAGAVCQEPYVSVKLPFRTAEGVLDCFKAIRQSCAPYLHQQAAFCRLTGGAARSTLIATGTGSGKTECFLYPILEHCCAHRGEPGIKALIIYPMNALASDQAKRIAQLIHNTPALRGNVTAGMYVGGIEESASRMMGENYIITDRETLQGAPPDILLTNYKMLDYLLVRPKDAALWQLNAPDTLKYIAVDELHTFDGAQGTDLACLLRRLKARLNTPEGHVCCIGTSATLGSKDNQQNILQYAREVFGEPFDETAVITEDRLTADEFFGGTEVTDFTLPTEQQVLELERLIEHGDKAAYINAALLAWTNLRGVDLATPEGQIVLGRHLMGHSFTRAMVTRMANGYRLLADVAEELKTPYPEIAGLKNAGFALTALLALISTARSGSPKSPRPFLNVDVKLWMRELRRLLAKVSGDDIDYSIAHDLNALKAKSYLPVVNCRDCGATGWTTVLNERANAQMKDLEAFYNLFFKADDKITMIFPGKRAAAQEGLVPGRICPSCLQVKFGEGGKKHCDKCGEDYIDVTIATAIQTAGAKKHKQFVCPFCASKRGLSLMGVRSATAISTELSQVFMSPFNDDKKTLAFSDSVQDAAHRAGFFNARTWKFGIRAAIQRYVKDGGAKSSLKDFSHGFIEYWRKRLTDEAFASLFIAPNMAWMRPYEELLEKRRLAKTPAAKELLQNIEKRLSYEIMLEYGLMAGIGRTLEKSRCSCLSFDSDAISRVGAAACERAVNEVGGITNTDERRFAQMAAGYLKLMAQSGAFNDGEYGAFIRSRGETYLLSNSHISWMPGNHSGRNTPRFLCIPYGNVKKLNFDTPAQKKYTDFIKACLNEDVIMPSPPEKISVIILEELVKAGIVTEIEASPEYAVYAIDKRQVYVTANVAALKCDTCGTSVFVSEANAAFWQGAPCLRSACGGELSVDESSQIDYYGKLFSAGDISRINAREHTGLLQRENREALEADFKRTRQDAQPFDPNVLSCTPTLEMGIDIGDLSTVFLCNIPPTQSQFLQRTGRAGRRDGNALTLTVAAAKPHDLYFYADPLEMMEGDVAPPKIFLRASAVLERQFTAYCMDCWVSEEAKPEFVPKNVSAVLGRLDAPSNDAFPFNFLLYVKNNQTRLFNSFIALFSEYLDDAAIAELKAFAYGDKLIQSPMYLRVLEAFSALKKQRDAVSNSVKQLKDMVADLKAKPKDSSYDEEIKELKAEQNALINVIKEINQKDIFNFLSDEGLLPNYAFPESGIVLKAVLYRKEDDVKKPEGQSRYKKSVYEYSRSASAAISEFAPNNSFYVDGRKLIIDQLDLTSAQAAKWRLCPNCSHAQIEEAGKNTACCPQCGSAAWADSGQVRNMLKVQMVYSNADYTKSLITDESDDRSNVFYCKQLLVDVDEDNDVVSAYEMNNDEFAFGYEFVKKAALREINFGERDVMGEKLTVSGVDDVRKGFRVCKHCGKIQPADPKKEAHTFYCKARKPQMRVGEPFEECLFLYREFTTEALRILVPATTMDASAVRKESFTAAFMLGMKEYFGNVDHLRATVSEVPLADSDYKKQYLVIYDSVPGGTGYLKQLMNEKGSLIDIFERALQKLEQCGCKQDPQKDGCYRCLYAHRQSKDIGAVSRKAAIRILKAILSGKDNLTKIDKLGSVSVNPLFDSELERRFIEAFASMGGENRKVEVTKSIINGKEGYILKINGAIWEIEPQVHLGAAQGVAVPCKPDFILRQINKKDKLPVAVFTDGFIYHKDKIADDTLKRMAVLRSGGYRVWALSWKDVQGAFAAQEDYAAKTLSHGDMPSGNSMYMRALEGKDALAPEKTPAFELLVKYLELNNAARLFEDTARAYALSLLDAAKLNDAAAFASWSAEFDKANNQLRLREEPFAANGTFFGTWAPRQGGAHARYCAAVDMASLKADKKHCPTVLAVLDDRADNRTDKYEADWNGFWHFFNVMQFNRNFAAVSATGLEGCAYAVLPGRRDGSGYGFGVGAGLGDGVSDGVGADTGLSYGSGADRGSVDAGWGEVRECLLDEEAVKMAQALAQRGVRAPDEVGCELLGASGGVVAEIELAWTDKKIGYMTKDQQPDMDRAAALGWTVFTSEDEIKKVFEGV